ncbi:MAG: transglutaminase family protein [Chitinophagales bacterium]|nr:transglutaminase family protein [Bacteroidota bacterium]MBP8250247.1 transglutaminase family protein [Chitinophagales bacterium]MBK9555065.1 transglutaminase family protein [Bacteroidota bacterium]MBL0281874.1 transglutaminase family protein [Bacteroidota bacterium]MCC6583612.1 transglutaminase family protein [Chitinophagales bacterium]
MSNESEIAALIALLDDSDQEVFDHVAARLIALGPMVIDKLEDAYTSIPNPVMQERIEELIHHIQFTRVEHDLKIWAEHENNDLLKGVLIITRHQYPELDEEKLLKTISRIQKDIWIGINNYLSPLEQMNVVNQTLFSHYQFLGLNNDDDELRYMYINNAVDALKGNHFAIGILYLCLCQQLDLPVYGVCLSAHFILARAKDYITDFDNKEENREEVLFYVNPYNKGLAFSEKEINIYLNKIGAQPSDKYFAPASNRQVLFEYVQYLISLLKKPSEQYKADDLRRLEDILAGE